MVIDGMSVSDSIVGLLMENVDLNQSTLLALEQCFEDVELKKGQAIS